LHGAAEGFDLLHAEFHGARYPHRIVDDNFIALRGVVT
jgi:hypothetical protein